MVNRRCMLLSSPSRDLSSLRKSYLQRFQLTKVADACYRATAVDGGYSFTVPEAPEGTAPISGQSYIVLTGCNTTVSDDTVAAGPGVVEITNLLA